jgi:hypothetical protein
MNRVVQSTLPAGLVLLILLLMLASVGACSDGGGPASRSAPAGPGQLGGATGHAIHVIDVRPDGTRKQLDFGQGTEILANAARGKPASGAKALKQHAARLPASAIHPLDNTVTMQPTVDQPGTDPQGTAWALVQRAAYQCAIPELFEGINANGGALMSTDPAFSGYLPPVAVDIEPWTLHRDASGNVTTADWFVFKSAGASCSGRLFEEQTMLCMADKLAEIGDAVGTVVWPSLLGACGAAFTFGGTDAPQDCNLFDEWDIPPQADRDRFIVRDLAIHTLGMLATLDAMPMSGVNNNPNNVAAAPCATIFAQVAAGTLPITTSTSGVFSDSNNSDFVFGVNLFGAGSCAPGVGGPPMAPLYPPSKVTIISGTSSCNPITGDNSQEIATTALEVEAQILRGGGRLLHDLIRRDVYSDLASGASLSAHALDPDLGHQILWGADPQTGPYGTLAHASRVLAGRWEIGQFPTQAFVLQDFNAFNGHGDPDCEQTRELAVLGAYGDDLTARESDRPIRTKGEALAARLVAQAGVVMPTCAITAAGGQLRQALADQLLLQADIQNGLPTGPSSLQSTVFTRLIGPLSDAEIVFGFEYALRTFRLLTDSGDIDPANCNSYAVLFLTGSYAGLTLSSNVADSTGAFQKAIVVNGGLDRSRLSTEPIARAGGVIEASECVDVNDNSAVGPWRDNLLAPWGMTATDPESLVVSGQPMALPPVVFQEAFSIGQHFERRLVFLGSAAAPLSAAAQTPSSADPSAVARGAIAELRTWAGSAIVHTFNGGPEPNGLGTLGVRISGMDYADVGLTAGAPGVATALENAFGFVVGPPWVAECAAHVRQDCPADFDTTWVQRATPGSMIVNDGQSGFADLPGLYGAQLPAWQFNVPYASGDPGLVSNFVVVPPFAPVSPGNSRVYMVLLHDPKSPTGQGRVLGTFPFQDVNTLSGFVIAPMQRELLHNALDLGKWVGAAPPRLGDPSASDTSGYCVDGLPRDVFVPLQNELTGDDTQSFENSWKHYLSIAQQAAATADGLAQQLLENDIRIEQRQEAADEKLADLCGDFGVVSRTSIDSAGHVSAPADDPSLAVCFSEPTTDVVFFSDVPPALKTAPDAQSQSKFLQCTVLQCGSAAAACNVSAPGLGASDPLCKKTTPLTFGTFSLVNTTQTAATTDVCSTLPAIASSLGQSFDSTDFLKILSDERFNFSGIQGYATGFKLNVDIDDHWSLTFGGAALMDSSLTTAWPGCLAGTGASPCGSVAAADLFNRAFRYCPGADPSTAPLGCDGGSASAELNMLRWRVASALWTIGSSAGQLPQGMFNIPVPVVTWPPAASSATVFGATAYPGQLVQTATPGQWKLTTATSTSSLNSNALGTAYDIASAFSAFTNSASNEIPPWYLSIYQSNASLFKHVPASNVAHPWGNCTISAALTTWGGPSDFCKGSGSAASFPPTPTPIVLGNVLSQAGGSLDGMQCTAPFGEPVKPGVQVTASIGDLMSALRTGYYQTEWATGGDQGWGAHPYPMLIEACTSSNGSISCPNNDWVTKTPLWTTNDGTPQVAASGAIHGTFSPSGYPASARAYVFANLTAENGSCAGVSDMLRAAALVCGAQNGAVFNPNSPPQVNDVSQIAGLEIWVRGAGKLLQQSAGQLYAEQVPTRVISDIQNNQVGTGNKSGAHGSDILDIEQAIRNFASAWIQAGTDLGAISASIQTARLAIQKADLSKDAADQAIALKRLEIEASQAQSIFGMIAKVAELAGSAAACVATEGAGCGFLAVAIGATVAGSTSGVASGGDELGVLAQQQDTNAQIAQTDIAQALNGLDATTPKLWADVLASMDALRNDVGQIQKASAALQLTAGQAAYQTAIGTGAEFVNIAGQDVPIPLNAVLKRQQSATAIRYQAALTNAKALSYMARRAIEQRLGVPLDALTAGVGPLPPPASWADDVCSLTGVNLAALRNVLDGGANPTVEQNIIKQLADSFVGDYVAKLQSFVDYFNVQYPSHEGDDTAVLSLRGDLLGPAAQCLRLSPNLLVNSGRLDAASRVNTTRQGWILPPCSPTAGQCLALLSGSALTAPQDGPAGALQSPSQSSVSFSSDSTGVTWLTDVLQSGVAGTADAGAADAGPLVPPAMVTQAVSLTPGNYVLSWWDQARDATGNLPQPSASLTPYLVRLMDAHGNVVVAEFSGVPFSAPASAGDAGSSSLWSPRRSLTFSITKPGTFFVAFGASVPGAGLGSVAIADVQLESPNVSNGPTPYVGTTDSRMVPAFNCPVSESDLRAAFQHNCDASGSCFYDLTVPLIIDTEALNLGGSPLAGKLARGNYNYRHINIALNLVGTGVRDCTQTPTPDCFGTGYVEYDLQHNGTNAGITDYNGNTRVFDFGLANVQHGKALAAERYITMPIGTADQQLLTQAGIQHVEFRGRPLDGAYHLRIWDSPALHFSQLQDVQIILNYRYWSEIVANGTGTLQGL